MVAGARLLALDIAAQDVRTSLEGLSHGDQVGVLVGVLAALGKHSGNVPVFLALVQATVRERLGVGA
jgi:hypothetical protein